MAFVAGQTVGDYEVIEVLGAGGMGTVYKVRHLISDRLEAIKAVLPELTDHPDLADRFMREIKVHARLSHPNIAALHNAFRMGNQMLMVMELVEGSTLYAALRNHRIDIAGAVRITWEILSALDYAHAQGVIHRDIKPANIMVTTAGKVKLMDFGIARSLAEDTRFTRTGAAVGSMYYMSPEQVQDEPVDGRADLYAVGVLLYEMATGVRPIEGDSSWTIMNGHINTVPRTPASLNPKISDALSACILKALEKKRENRFQSAREFAESLSKAGTSPAYNTLPQTELAAAPVQKAPASAPTPTPAPAPTPPRNTQPTAAHFETERLEKLTHELAFFVGPVAKALVHRAARKAETWRQLYDLLAPEVPEGSERKRFLSRRP